MKVLKGDNASV